MRVCLRPLRSNAVDVAGEHGAFRHIRYSEAEEAGGDALEADGEAAVRGHAVSPAPLCPLSRARAPQARISHPATPREARTADTRTPHRPGHRTARSRTSEVGLALVTRRLFRTGHRRYELSLF